MRTYTRHLSHKDDDNDDNHHQQPSKFVKEIAAIIIKFLKKNLSHSSMSPSVKTNKATKIK